MSRARNGFTLLEVLVALTIVGFAVVSLIELAAQGTRLLKVSGDHQRAVDLADRLTQESDPSEEGVESGEDGPFAWERRVSLVVLPDELLPRQTVPGAEEPKLYAIAVAVRWGRNQQLEVATLRSPGALAPSGASPPAGQAQPGEPQSPAGQPGAGQPRPDTGQPGRPQPGTGRPGTRS